jgi:hypothetical protein
MTRLTPEREAEIRQLSDISTAWQARQQHGETMSDESRMIVDLLSEIDALWEERKVLDVLLEQDHIPSGEFWLPNRKTVWFDGGDGSECWRLMDEKNVCDMDVSYPTALAAIAAGMGWESPRPSSQTPEERE